jgi:hypothetical protein
MESVHKEEGHPAAVLPTLLAMAEGSIGSSMFLSLYVKRPDGPYDAIQKGKFPCAFCISFLLHGLGLIKDVHTNVKETEEDLVASGWDRIEIPITGAVIIWAAKMASDKNPHRHIGLYLGNLEAISTDGTTGQPTKHHMTYGFTDDGEVSRKIEAIYIHPALLS